MGIRAEDIKITDPLTAALVGSVFSVEPTGEATLIVVQYEDTRLVVKADKAIRPEINAQIGLMLNDNGMRFFDTATGQRVRPQS